MNRPLERQSFGVAERYRIEREIGRGGAATVYLALDRKHDRRVALKLLNAELSAAMATKRFIREIALLARLQHPHILPLLDSGEASGSLFFVMPFIDGESLRERLAREQRLPVEDALQITKEVAGALGYAHERGVIHRDIKPENILLSSGQAVLSDFGVARAISRASGEFQSLNSGELGPNSKRVMVGTPAYVSPEQASGDPNIDGRTDQFALACVTYEMLAGTQPFYGPTAQATIAQRFTATPTTIATIRNEVSPEIDAALRRALSIIPAERFPTVEEFVAALEAGVTPAMTQASEPQKKPWWRLF